MSCQASGMPSSGSSAVACGPPAMARVSPGAGHKRKALGEPAHDAGRASHTRCLWSDPLSPSLWAASSGGSLLSSTTSAHLP